MGQNFDNKRLRVEKVNLVLIDFFFLSTKKINQIKKRYFRCLNPYTSVRILNPYTSVRILNAYPTNQKH